jgi:hypothetical protein
MRMWMVEPELMCDRHLLGEHAEIHMLAGSISRKKSIKGFLHGLVNPNLMQSRHDALVCEMTRRGMRHKSPLATVDYHRDCSEISIQDNMRELARRCPRCAESINKIGADSNVETRLD